MSLTPKQLERLAKATETNVVAKNKRIEEYNKKPSLCFNCEMPLCYDKRHNKYCGRSCSASKNNIGKARNVTIKSWMKKSCIECGKETSNKKFCSRDCFFDYSHKETIANIQTTGVLNGHPTTIKKYLVETNGHKCEICDLKEWMGKQIPLVLDHINGKPTDNSIVNLRLVCGNCNMQLPTFAGKNVGNGGRPYRKKRYHEGKCW